nr:XTP/dITP diphosphatase [Evansella caseinilytica]
MNQVFIATQNQGKVKEFKAFFGEKGIEVKSLADVDETIDVVENGSTFEENAIIKAETIGKMIQHPVIADDSGLEVTALNGEPGIFSARYAGVGKDDAANNRKLLEKLDGVPVKQRGARFVCALAVYIPGKETQTIRGVCDGLIAYEPVGTNGFGYDPLFFLPSLNKTMAQLDRKEKNTVSHRANALKQLAKKWNEWFR